MLEELKQLRVLTLAAGCREMGYLANVGRKDAMF